MENLIYAQECGSSIDLGTLKIITPLKGYCEIENCTEKAAYNLPRVKPAIRCKAHKITGMIYSKNPLCKGLDDTCPKCPSYNIKGAKSGKFCIIHKVEGMVDVVSAMCEVEDCPSQATYNFKSIKKPIRCLLHKKDDMINVRDPRCNIEGCDTQAMYNYEGLKKPIRCYTHGKDEGMVNVVTKKCIGKLENGDPCKLIASFGKDGIVNHCAKHIEDGEKDLRHKKCEKIDCDKQACCGIEGTKTVHFCAEHCPPEMVNIRSERCIGILENGKNCKTIASCNYSGHKARLYCSSCKLPGMVDIANLNNLCKINEINPNKTCTTRALFNKKGETVALYCQVHAMKGMVNVLDKRKCQNEEEECNKRPIFNVEGAKKGMYCAKHKKIGMIDIFSKRCKSTWCYTSPKSDKYKGYCLFCFVNLFPDQKITRNYKTKEFAVVEFVKSNFPLFDWTTDKIIKDGCSKRRPDLLLDLGYQVIIVEVDEDQHTDYETICENRRMMELSQDLNHRPIIFIRFNPDSYTDNDVKITSCWGFNKDGLSHIKKNKVTEWADRLNTLKETIIHWSKPENVSDKILETVKLFYD
jgi:hypothetical protein